MRLRELLRNSSFVAIGGLLGGAAGLALRSVIAYRYGATVETDALLAALQTTESLTTPLVWILSITFIPTFTRASLADREDAWVIARTVVVFAAMLFAALALLVAAAASPIARWVVGGGDDRVIGLTAAMIPAFGAAVAVAGLGGLFAGILQATLNFWLPAFATPIRASVGIVVVAVAAGRFGIWAAVAGMAFGYVLQTSVVLLGVIRPLLRRPHAAMGHPAVRNILWMIVPMTGGTLLGQINYLISVRFASGSGEGGITLWNYAFGLAAVVASAVGSSTVEAAFPHLSQSASVNGSGSRLRSDVTLLVRLAIFSTLVTAAGLAAAGTDLAHLLFGHGPFAGAPAEQTGRILVLYGLGFPALVFPTLLSRVFYSRSEMVVPQALVSVALVTNVALASVLVPRYGIYGVAASSLAGLAAQSAAMGAVLNWRNRLLDGRPIRSTLCRASVVALAVYAVMVGTRALAAVGEHPATVARLLGVSAMAVAGGLVFTLLVLAFDEFGARGFLARWWTNRRAGRRSSPGLG